MNNNKIFKVDSEISDLLTQTPIKSKIILSNFKYNNKYFIKKLELLLYLTNINSMIEQYTILLIKLETNNGTIIMKYDEGHRDSNIFDDTIELLTKYNGLSSLINRALIELNEN
ncbi:MAG TPA: hypothetical protein VFV86_00880 [Nitrososphaeraceae archaeon]|nr:hypothetical protein [Nitrososphaeraceae archaeon]